MLRNVLTSGVMLACIAAVIVLVLFYTSFDYSRLPNDYAIVFDAGSSGSRMYIYEWRAGFSAAKGESLELHQKLQCKASDNGLDKIKSRDELISKYSECMRMAETTIPDDRKGRAYLFLAATAGMRLLEVRNKTASDEIFEYVRDYFANSSFLFANRSQARIISGQEEGTNAWISANYYEKNFEANRLARRKDQAPQTKGILDLGGASTQIVYVPPNTDESKSNGQFTSSIRIYGVEYRPYSHSFLCWGVNEIAMLYKTHLLAVHNYPTVASSGSSSGGGSGGNVAAGCYPRDSQVKLVGAAVLSSPCATGLVFADRKYNHTADPGRVDKNAQYLFTGKSSREECEKEMAVIIPKPTCPYEGRCSFDAVYQPPLDGAKFMAFSGIFYAASNTKRLMKQKTDFTMAEFENATDYICSLSLEQLVQLNASSNAGIAREDFLINQCFSNVYVLSLLKSYGFLSFDNLKITDKINGFNLNWALGYMINELNRDDFLPYEEPPRRLNLSVFLPLVVVLSALTLVLGVLMLYSQFKQKRNSSRRRQQQEPQENAESIAFNHKDNTEADT